MIKSDRPGQLAPNPDIMHSFLIVSGEGAQKGKFDEQVYIVDAVPTLLTYLGIEIDNNWELDGNAVGLKADASP